LILDLIVKLYRYFNKKITSKINIFFKKPNIASEKIFFSCSFSDFGLMKDGSLHLAGSFESKKSITSIEVYFDNDSLPKKVFYTSERNNDLDIFSGFFGSLYEFKKTKLCLQIKIIFRNNDTPFHIVEKKIEKNTKNRLEKWTRFFERSHPQQTEPENNFKQLVALKNSQVGKIGFLIGNGPSVRIDDLEHLSDACTFGCNRLYLAYNQMKFRPTYLMSSDKQAIEDFGQEMVDHSQGNVIFVSDSYPHFQGSYLWTKLATKTPLILPNDITRYVMPGGGTLISAIQVGIYMGIKHFYIYGMDHSFKFENSGVTDDRYRSVKGDNNHFIKNYRGNNFWCPPATKIIEGALLSLNSYLNIHSGWIKNATRGGALDVLDRVDFDLIKSHKRIEDLTDDFSDKNKAIPRKLSFKRVTGEIIWYFEKHSFGFAKCANDKRNFFVFKKNSLSKEKETITVGTKINFYPYITEMGGEAFYYKLKKI
jgi:hypothetical protein